MVTKEKAELWQKWADVNRMCVGTDVNPLMCVKLDNVVWGHISNDCPSFQGEISLYQFARGIAEGKPFFEGNTLWLKQLDGNYVQHVVTADFDINGLFTPPLWNPPKRTIRINGKEFPSPVINSNHNWQSHINMNGKVFYFDKNSDAKAVEQELIKILEGK